MEQINNKEARARAERRVDALSGFYSHLLTYCLVNAGLFLINYLSSPHHLWFFYPLFGWGTGLLFHGLSICRRGLWCEAWRERKIAELMEKENLK
ncbi:MAG: 2TM domain-containing protein [Prevotellaceae bacterium]|jgi:hypothetical protein|nr:2TM domain-containing protein [Prevotellaceae bacterium]